MAKNEFAHKIVDSIQDTKKKFVEQVVFDHTVKTALTKFVDAQAQYTKDAIDAGMESFTALSSVVSNPNYFKDLAKYTPNFFKAK